VNSQATLTSALRRAHCFFSVGEGSEHVQSSNSSTRPCREREWKKNPAQKHNSGLGTGTRRPCDSGRDKRRSLLVPVGTYSHFLNFVFAPPFFVLALIPCFAHRLCAPQGEATGVTGEGVFLRPRCFRPRKKLGSANARIAVQEVDESY
jgi:hypothetical protein